MPARTSLHSNAKQQDILNTLLEALGFYKGTLHIIYKI
jgi:uncharacterized membrane protein YqaE (UPF0057 family)